ncbi:MAG TPA: DUF3175 domain-containing protein [Candidatus Nanoarchaeia archaeon]|nr:DUF3175 domain-containing protein [Candidatus Nanoarchaeia archaeon]
MATKKRWSKQVTEKSRAIVLEQGVFTKKPKEIARYLLRSAKASTKRKSTPFRSAMSMLNFYMNRAGKNLSLTAKKRLEKAKEELRKRSGK